MIQSPNSLVPRDFPSGIKRARSFVASPFEKAFAIGSRDQVGSFVPTRLSERHHGGE